METAGLAVGIVSLHNILSISRFNLTLTRITGKNQRLSLTTFEELSRGKHQYRQTSSKRSRIAWAVGGREKLNKDVLMFEGLVKVLRRIANPVDIGIDRLTACTLHYGSL